MDFRPGGKLRKNDVRRLGKGLKLGKSLLREVLAASQDNLNQGIYSLYLALVPKRQGRLEEAKPLASRSAQLYPQPWTLTRIQQEFPHMPVFTSVGRWWQ